jgi:hypothetical protein
MSLKQISQFKYSMSTKKKRLGFLPQSKRLYSYNLQEDLYLEQISRRNIATIDSKKKFLTLKRHLYSMRFYARHKNIRSVPFTKDTKFSLDIMYYNNLIFLEPLIMILPSSFSQINLVPNPLKIFVKTEVSSSFHAAFSFIENEWQNCCYVLETEMPSYLHPEIFIRMIGLRTQDVAFVDLLRRKFHTTSLKLTHPSANTKNGALKKLTTILWNLWVLEFEDFLQKECITLLDQIQLCYHNSTSFLHKLYFLNLNVSNTQILSDKDFCEIIQNSQYILDVTKKSSKNGNFVRYANNWLIGIEGNLLVIQALRRRCIRFWKHRIGILMVSSKLNIISLYHHNSCFLGTILKFKVNEFKIQARRSDASLLPRFLLTKKSLMVTLPLVSLVMMLSECGFCKSNGYPISKSNWSILPDSKIIERFSHILISISCHYSGCVNRRKLSNIQYILCYSCAKTLACKHKTNVKSILYTYAKEFTRNHLSLAIINTPNLDLLTPINQLFIKQKRMAIWDFNHLDPDPMVLVFIKR